MDLYTPCRTSENYYDNGDFVEVANKRGLFRITGLAAQIWRLLDGKHTIASIRETISLDAELTPIKLQDEIVEFLYILENKQCIILNWNPSLLRDEE